MRGGLLGEHRHGTAWPGVRHHLRRIGYAPVGEAYVDLSYQPDDGERSVAGMLVVGFRQMLAWGGDKVLKVRFQASQSGVAMMRDLTNRAGSMK